MEVVFERCAGLDVHKQNVVACVRVSGRKGNGVVKTFNTMTHGLQALRDWLVAEQVTHVAMESTGVYWKPVWNILEDHFELLLCNAKQVKQVPGRKTDVNDCEWLAKLLQHGLLSPSFVPDRGLRDMRDLTRYRVKLTGQHTAEVNRIQAVLEDANLKLGDVASDIMGASGRAILDALVAGETDPAKLASMAKKSLKKKIPELKLALDGKLTAHHRFILGMHLEATRSIEAAIAKLDARIAEITGPPPSPPGDRPDAMPGSEEPSSASAEEGASARGEPPLSMAEALRLVCTIPGISLRLAQDILAEIGPDMSQFHSSGALASWAGMCPGNNESAGKKRSGRTKKGSSWLKRSLGIAGSCCGRLKDSFLATRHRRVAKRSGKLRAVVASGHALLRVIYAILTLRQEYSDRGADYFDRINTTRQIRYHQRRLRELQAMSAPAA
ncbi:MAG TPA: IS110 family transposase [Planctomycetota bacterium]|nr:IS110 family transposase [Planctomycetota bacterium]